MNHLFKLNKHSSTFCAWVTYIDFLKNIEPFFFYLVFRILSSSWEDSLKAREEKEVVGSLGDFLPDCCECLGLGNHLSLERTGELQVCFLEWSRDTVGRTQSLPWWFRSQGQPWPPPGQPRGPLGTSPMWCRGCKVKNAWRGFCFILLEALKLQYWLISDSFQICLPFYSVLWNYSKGIKMMAFILKFSN